MRKTKLNIWIAGIIVMFMLTGFQANAQRDRGHGSHKGYKSTSAKDYGEGTGSLSRMESTLDLTEEQKTQIDKLHLDLQKESLPAKNKVREKWAQLQTLITENGDESNIDKLIDDIGDLQVTIDKQRIKTHLKVRELLTEEQKIKFDTRLGNRFIAGGYHLGSIGFYGRGRK